MIDNKILKAGSSPEKKNLNIDLTPITVFVGPNNSGKSKVLIEIENYSRTHKKDPKDLIIEQVKLTNYESTELDKEIEKLQVSPRSNETISEDEIIIQKLNSQSNQSSRLKIKKADLLREAATPNERTVMFKKYPQYLSLFTLRLDGTNRLNLLKEQDAGDLQNSSLNHLSHLFKNNDLRAKLSKIIHEAFEKFFVIDPTNVGKLRVRLSSKKPKTEREEKGWDELAVNFHSEANLIEEASDGVKAFSGIMTTILAGDPKVTLIDEPEAFLHPSLSNQLGKEIGKSLVNSSKKKLFVATHSSAFLMGCIQSGAPLNIVRLTYKNGVATSRLLEKDKILKLMRHPLLRSTGVLNGLFYESVIVTEADSDRAFYQEINERLLAIGDKRGIANCLFINAQNKQTVWEIVQPLRELGIPAVGIVDIDVLKEGGKVFKKLLDGSFTPELSHQSLHNQRKSLYDKFNQTGKKWKREGGIDLLENQDKEACSNFLDQLTKYGVFVVPGGELESWLTNLNGQGHGPDWLIDIFSKMGDNPNSEEYLSPNQGDIWDFIGEIKKWIEDPLRKGIPA